MKIVKKKLEELKPAPYNPRKISKKEYENFINNRNKYIDNVKKGVDSVASFDFNISFDDNGEKREIDFSYEPSKEDKHSMLSDASDVDAMIKRRYQTKEGFNHQKLSEDLWWGEEANRNKVFAAAMEKVRADTIEEVLSYDNNENFKRRPLSKSNKKIEEGYGSLAGGSNTQVKGGIQFGFKQ